MPKSIVKAASALCKPERELMRIHKELCGLSFAVHRCSRHATVQVFQRYHRNFQFRQQHVARGWREGGLTYRVYGTPHHAIDRVMA